MHRACESKDQTLKKIRTLHFSEIKVQQPYFQSGKEKPININILGRTLSGTNRNRPQDKRDPPLGQIAARLWDKPAVICLIPQ